MQFDEPIWNYIFTSYIQEMKDIFNKKAHIFFGKIKIINNFYLKVSFKTHNTYKIYRHYIT